MPSRDALPLRLRRPHRSRSRWPAKRPPPTAPRILAALRSVSGLVRLPASSPQISLSFFRRIALHLPGVQSLRRIHFLQSAREQPTSPTKPLAFESGGGLWRDSQIVHKRPERAFALQLR